MEMSINVTACCCLTFAILFRQPNVAISEHIAGEKGLNQSCFEQ